MKYEPDHVILAAGSHYASPPFEGTQYAISADTALLTPETVGASAVIIGAGLVGCETAMTLTETKGCQVTLVDMLPDAAPDMEPSTRLALKHRLEKDGIAAEFNWKVESITPGTVNCIGPDNSKKAFNADTIILAAGLKANKDVVSSYESLQVPVTPVGDCVEARKFYDCFLEAWHAAFFISGLL